MTFQQDTSGAMRYPAKGTLNNLLFKIPAILWRMGLGPIQGRFQLVLSTWGRKSGLPRHTMLSRAVYQGKSYILSGWNQRSDWYKNLSQDNRVTVQDDRRTYTARARRVTQMEEYTRVMGDILASGGDTHFQPWLQSLDIRPEIADLVTKHERVYLVALDPCVGKGHPPPMDADLKWVWAAAAFAIFSGWLHRYRRGKGML
jgi:deazaflavin-dependent oxidoreductase (nitroreductase family)